MQPLQGPDFICVGLPRAGTGWLYDQLSGHPDFWMPPIKEIGFFREGTSGTMGNRLQHKAEGILARLGGKAHNRRNTDDARSMEFLESAGGGRDGAEAFGFYVGLFAGKGDHLSGDITPGYATLGPKVIARMGDQLPGVRFVLLVRDPVERFWSQLSLKARGGKVGDTDITDWRQLRRYLKLSRVAARSFPTQVWRRWDRTLPGRARYFLFDDIVADPEATRARILEFIGGDPGKPSAVAATHNRKSGRFKPEMTPEIRARLIGHFAKELKACGTTFGGAAQGWAARYGL